MARADFSAPPPQAPPRPEPGRRALSGPRLAALCRKEVFQIIRDPSSIIISFVLPVVLLVIFGYGINFDSGALRIGLVLEDQSAEARRLADCFRASTYIDARVGDNRKDMERLMQGGKLRGIVVVPADFSRRLAAGAPRVQVIADGSEPNTANFVHAYVSGVWSVWRQNRNQDLGVSAPGALFDAQARFWFNQDAVSRNFIVPGAITIIITVIGAILTSLVIAREWERGTMEALLAAGISRAELLLSKFIPYYVLGMFALGVCIFVSVLIFRVPYRGSYFLLWGVSTLFLSCTLGLGLLISTLTRNQFNAAQIALNAAFLPAIMLSGFVFEIDSMPLIVRGVAHLVPAKYYVSAMQTLFLAGNVPFILAINSLFLLGMAALLLGLATAKTKMRLE